MLCNQTLLDGGVDDESNKDESFLKSTRKKLSIHWRKERAN
jgi:hypothetical protein